MHEFQRPAILSALDYYLKELLQKVLAEQLNGGSSLIL